MCEFMYVCVKLSKCKCITLSRTLFTLFRLTLNLHRIIHTTGSREVRIYENEYICLSVVGKSYLRQKRNGLEPKYEHVEKGFFNMFLES